MTRLSSEILSPPPIFETHREMPEYPKCQTHSVIGLYSNLVEKLSSKNELSIPAEFLFRFDDITELKCNHWREIVTFSRVAEVVRGHGRPKSLDSDENFKSEHTLFCRDLRTFLRSLGKKSAFLGQEMHYYMVYIAYLTELILKICYYA